MRERALLLKQEGHSNTKIADLLGVGRRTIDNWLAQEGGSSPAPGGGGLPDGETPQVDGEPTTRRAEKRPTPPSGARVVPTSAPEGAAQLDYRAIQGYVEGAYKIAAKVSRERGDKVLADVIDEHASPAARAWARWVESEPRVAELLRKLLVGTPAGEVIAVHVSIVFSYTLARGAAARLAADAAEREPAAA